MDRLSAWKTSIATTILAENIPAAVNVKMHGRVNLRYPSDSLSINDRN